METKFPGIISCSTWIISLCSGNNKVLLGLFEWNEILSIRIFISLLSCFKVCPFSLALSALTSSPLFLSHPSPWLLVALRPTPMCQLELDHNHGFMGWVWSPWWSVCVCDALGWKLFHPLLFSHFKKKKKKWRTHSCLLKSSSFIVRNCLFLRLRDIRRQHMLVLFKETSSFVFRIVNNKLNKVTITQHRRGVKQTGQGCRWRQIKRAFFHLKPYWITAETDGTILNVLSQSCVKK